MPILHHEMTIQIQGRDVELTKKLRARIERRLGFALSRFGDRVGRVTLRFSNVDGADLRCRIDVTLRPRVISVEQSDADLLVALDLAADRAGRSVARALARERAL